MKPSLPQPSDLYDLVVEARSAFDNRDVSLQNAELVGAGGLRFVPVPKTVRIGPQENPGSEGEDALQHVRFVATPCTAGAAGSLPVGSTLTWSPVVDGLEPTATI